MELAFIIDQIREIERGLTPKCKMIECYLFGSALKSLKMANDIDILILYEDVSHLESAKKYFKDLGKIFPLHLTCFTFSEEAEFNFIEEQKAIRIFKL